MFLSRLSLDCEQQGTKWRCSFVVCSSASLCKWLVELLHRPLLPERSFLARGNETINYCIAYLLNDRMNVKIMNAHVHIAEVWKQKHSYAVMIVVRKRNVNFLYCTCTIQCMQKASMERELKLAVLFIHNIHIFFSFIREETCTLPLVLSTRATS